MYLLLEVAEIRCLERDAGRRISSALMVSRDLPAVWEWFDYRRALLSSLQPNAAHLEIAQWQDRFPTFTLVTQNVDGLHQQGGSRDVIELHGSIWRARCVTCGATFEIQRNSRRPEACVGCGDALRPDVVLFGEFVATGVREGGGCGKRLVCVFYRPRQRRVSCAGLPEIARAAGAYVAK